MEADTLSLGLFTSSWYIEMSLLALNLLSSLSDRNVLRWSGAIYPLHERLDYEVGFHLRA